MASDYPASRKLFAAVWQFQLFQEYQRSRMHAGQPLAANYNQQWDKKYRAVEKWWPATVAEPGVPGDDLEDNAWRILRFPAKPGSDQRKEYFDLVYPPLEKSLPATSDMPWRIKGIFYTDWAWDARGIGLANTVTPEGWKLFRERLADSRAALEKAWELNPDEPDTAARMITVAMGQSLPRDQMEVWFQRAIRIDADYYGAYERKMTYLEPKWHGSAAELLAFGHECLAGRNWAGSVPFFLVSVHKRLASYEQDKEAYWGGPGVWDDLCAVYVPFLKADPENHYTRSNYCYYACLSGHWEEAARQFKILGDHADPGPFGGPEKMREFRERTAEKQRGRS
jgi:hypothetical protein